ncbi:MAG: hypothetical protein ACQEUN_16700 [Pseudomonadota bacterium]
MTNIMLSKVEQDGKEQGCLLQYAQGLWVRGEWEKLVALEERTIRQYAHRSEVALLVASAHLQLGGSEKGRFWLKKAIGWGLDRNKALSILMSGVSNSLGKVYSLKGDNEKAVEHFCKALEKEQRERLPSTIRARMLNESRRLGLQDDIIDRIAEQMASYCGDTNESSFDAVVAKKTVEECFEQGDVQDAIDHLLLDDDRGDEEQYELCIAIAEAFYRQDRMQAISWINQARLFLSSNRLSQPAAKYYRLAELAARFDQPDLAIDLSVEGNLHQESLTQQQKSKVQGAYHKIRGASEKSQQHGHDLLIDYLKEHSAGIHEGNGASPVMIEVGTTRENVPGQGSTLQLASIAKRQGIRFISVDMDPHNSRWAKFNLDLLGVPGETVTEKGEIFLKEFPGNIDYAFLDAYDYDHGKHSALRQQRYEKYLGSEIDEIHCYQMHLECARSLVKKLSPDGVICIDDTWQNEEGKWTAKGTQAVPFLLDNDFTIVEARNRAVLMRRKEARRDQDA